MRFAYRRYDTPEQSPLDGVTGLGTGVPCLATAESGSSGSFLLHAQTLADQQAAASHGAATT